MAITIVLLTAMPIRLSAQYSGKRLLAKEDYQNWQRIFTKGISQSGSWISFLQQGANGEEILRLISNDGRKSYDIAGGYSGAFIEDKWFTCLTRSGNLIIKELDGDQVTFAGVNNYQVATDNTILYMQEKAGRNTLFVAGRGGKISDSITDCISFKYSPVANTILFASGSTSSQRLGIYDLHRHKEKTVVEQGNFCFYDLTWQPNGQCAAFIKRANNKTETLGSIGYYALRSNEVKWFDPARHAGFGDRSKSLVNALGTLSISQDGNRVFFYMETKKAIPERPIVQVWNTDDKEIYPNRILSNKGQNIDKLAMWEPSNGRFLQITDNEHPFLMLNGSQTHAIVYNTTDYEPQFNMVAARNYYLIDLATGVKKLILENQDGNANNTHASPGGKYIAYFKDGHWWVYDIAEGRHYNVSRSIPYPVQQEGAWAGGAPGYKIPGWTKDDGEILLYDKYDLWIVSPHGEKASRVTYGRTQQLQYRIVPQNEQQRPVMNYNGDNIPGRFDITKPIMIEFTGLMNSGFCRWSSKENLYTMHQTVNHCEPAIMSDDGHSIVFTEENYNVPQYINYKKDGSTTAPLYKSNPQHQEYHWGTSELISYNANGQELHGALYYPAGYDPNKSYPMVVRVYEMQSHEVNKYVNPSEFNAAGFNISNLTSQGYFVLLPDIAFTIGSPGRSAVDCVTEAVMAAMQKASIDRKKLALTGHSFGGWETAYIISQTNLFTAAVASAGTQDLITGFLYLSRYTGIPNYWRYEYGQFRMGFSPYDNYLAYLENSPLFNADKINTPLLSFSGEEDYQVHHVQGLNLHMALRRLNKQSTFLLYPGQGHIFTNPVSQQHCTASVEKWLDYFLKDGAKPDYLK